MNKHKLCVVTRDTSFGYDDPLCDPERIASLIDLISFLQKELCDEAMSMVHLSKLNRNMGIDNFLPKIQEISRLKLRISEIGVDIQDLPDYEILLTYFDYDFNQPINRIEYCEVVK